MSVKLVNELRLDTTDPRGQEVWLKQMKTLSQPRPGAADPWSRFLDKRVVVETDGAACVVRDAPRGPRRRVHPRGLRGRRDPRGLRGLRGAGLGHHRPRRGATLEPA
jgi:hypothetical protein